MKNEKISVFQVSRRDAAGIFICRCYPTVDSSINYVVSEFKKRNRSFVCFPSSVGELLATHSRIASDVLEMITK